MMKFALAAAAAALFAFSAPANASPASGTGAEITDVSSQVTIREGRRGGVRVRIGERDRHRRWESRRVRRSRDDCRKVTVVRRENGRTIRRTTTRCR